MSGGGKQSMMENVSRFNKELAQLFTQTPLQCGQKLKQITENLRYQRQEVDVHKTFIYATNFVLAPQDEREEFFSIFTLLVDRQPDKYVRKKVIELLVEVAHIQTTSHNSNKKNRQNMTSVSKASETSFGYLAFQTLKELLPAVKDIGGLLVDYIIEVKEKRGADLANPNKREKAGDFFGGMDVMHVVELMPLLHDMVKNNHVGDELYTAFSCLTDTFAETFSHLLDFGNKSAFSENEKHDVGADVMRMALLQCGEILALCSQDPITSASYFEARIHVELVKSNTRNAMETAKKSCPSMKYFSIYSLIGALSMTCKPTAEFFFKDKPGGDTGMFHELLNSLSMQLAPEEGVENFEENEVIEYANQINCVYGILNMSERAVKFLKAVRSSSPQSLANLVARFIQYIGRVADHRSIVLVSACINFILMIHHNEKLEQGFMQARESAENFPKLLIKTLRSLVLDGSSDKFTIMAVQRGVELMTFWNKNNPTFSDMLNEPGDDSGWDREKILFFILLEQGGTGVADDIRVAAAHCLASVPLDQIDKKELENLLTIFSSLPVFNSEKTYSMLMVLLFLSFQLALSGTPALPNDQGEEGGEAEHEDGEEPEKPVGDIFREVYAAEMVSTLLSIISKLMQVDTADGRGVSQKRRFLAACVKMMMVAWNREEFRPTMDKEIQTLMQLTIKSDHMNIRQVYQRVHSLTQENRCVVCEEVLPKPKPGQFSSEVIKICRTCRGKREASVIRTLLSQFKQEIMTEQRSLGLMPDEESAERGAQKKLKKRGSVFTDSELIDYYVLEGFLHIHLEQTYLGFSVPIMASCLHVITTVDEIAFRVLHQIANTLEGYPQNNYFSELVNCKDTNSDVEKLDFDRWNSMPGGVLVTTLMEHEQMSWEKRAAQVSQAKESFNFKVRAAEATRKDSKILTQIQGESETKVSSKNLNRQRKGKEKKWEQFLQDTQHDSRYLTLIAFQRDGTDEPAASCGGGPLKKSNDGGPPCNNGLDCELYGIFVTKNLPLQQQTEIQCVLLRDFSHKMALAGYRFCYAQVSPALRVLFSFPSTELIKTIADTGEMMFRWELTSNPWNDQQAMRDFVTYKHEDQNVISMMLDFMLSRAQDLAVAPPNFVSTIRNKMDQFGGQLLLGENADDDEEEDEEVAPLTGNASKFYDKLMWELMDSSRGFSLASSWPARNMMLCGKQSEDFLMLTTKTPMLDPNPNPDPDPQDDPTPDNEDDLKAMLEQKEQDSRPKDFDDSHKAYKASVAALLRALWVSIKDGGVNRDKVLAEIRTVDSLTKLRQIMLQMSYGLRPDVFNESLPDRYQSCAKLLQLLHEVYTIDPVGLEPSLNALEVFETVAQIIKDILYRLVVLLKSRDQANPLAYTVRLYPYEEYIMALANRALSELVQQVLHTNFFPTKNHNSDKQAKIIQGNAKCRDKAIKLIFINSRLQDALYYLLLYDRQLVTDFADGRGTNLSTDEQAIANKFPYWPVREDSLIHISTTLAALFRVHPPSRYQFIENFNINRINNHVNLRSTLLNNILTGCNMSRFLAKFEGVMMAGSPLFEAGECVIDGCFVEVAVQNGPSENGLKLLVLTNKNYYLSQAVFQSSVVYDPQIADLPDLLYEKRPYTNIARLYIGKTGQEFAIRRFLRGGKDTGPGTANVTDIYIAWKLGDAVRLLQTFKHYARDDLQQHLPTGVCHKPKNEQLCTLVRVAQNNGEKLKERMVVWNADPGSRDAQIKVYKYDKSCWDVIGDSKSQEILYSQTPSRPYLVEDTTLCRAMVDLQSHTTGASVATELVFSFNTGKHLKIHFYCDASLELWRRQLTQFTQSGSGKWSYNFVTTSGSTATTL